MTTYAEYFGAVFPAPGDVESGAGDYGPNGDDFSPTFIVPAEADVADGEFFGEDGTEFEGTLVVGGGTYPTESQVLTGVQFGPGGTDYTGNVVLPDADDVIGGVMYGPSSGTTGVYVVVTGSFVLNGVAFGPNANLLGIVDLPSAASVLDTATFGANGGTSGTYHAPEAAEVISTAVFGPSSGTSGTVVLPAVGDVQEAVTFGDASALTGTFGVPTEAQVQIGVGFGEDDTEFTGSLAGGGASAEDIADEVINGLSSLVIVLASPYDQKEDVLKLVKNGDYKTGTPLGPLSFLITGSNIADADVVNFGAELEQDGVVTESIAITGAVVDVSGTMYARFEIDGTDLAKTPSVYWRWGLDHVNGSGDVCPLKADKEMWLLADRVG